MPVKVKMHIATKLVISLYIVYLALSYRATQAKPAEEHLARTKHEAQDDWFSSLFGDYFDDDDSESQEYLICRNCTVIVGQANATQTTVPPATNPPTAAPTAAPAAPPVAVAPTAAPSAPPAAVAPTAAPTTTPAAAAPTAAPPAAPSTPPEG